MADNAGLVSQLLSDPNPEKQLRKLINEILAITQSVPVEPSETISSRNAGRLIVEAAAEEMPGALTALLLAAPSQQPHRDECLQAACGLLRSAWTIAPYDTAAIPGTARTVLGREQAQEQARVARAAKQRKPRPANDQDRAFQAAVEQLRQEGKALTTAELLRVIRKYLPQGETIDRHAVDRRLWALLRRRLLVLLKGKYQVTENNSPSS